MIIVSRGWFFYYPFGKFSNLNNLKKTFASLSFKQEYSEDKANPPDSARLYRFYKDKSFVKFIDQQETYRFEIVSGSITDTAILLTDGTKIGMDKLNFLTKYFNLKADDVVN